MKLLVLHGPAIEASRQKLLDLRKKIPVDNVIYFDKEVGEKDVAAALQTTSLFEGERLVIWENPPENFIDYTLYPNPYTLVFWFDHEIDSKPWNNAEVLFFPEAKEVSVFPFLDFLGSRDKRAFLELDKLKKAGFDFQYLNTMILYLLRNLVVTPKGAKDFVKNKNARMRKNFSDGELVNLYYFVLKTDFKIKSGLLETGQAEFSLVNLFTH